MGEKADIGVLFDIDGVLIDTIPIHLRAFDAALGDYGLSLAQLSHDHWASSVRSLINSVGIELGIIIEDPRAFSDRINLLIMEELRDGVTADPELVNFLKELEKFRIGCAIGTSAVRFMAETKLDMLCIRKFFKGLVCIEDTKRSKPDPDVYLRGAALLGVPPARCIVIEDAESGVEAGKRAGMKVVGFSKFNADKSSPKGADLYADAWGDLSYKALKFILG